MKNESTVKEEKSFLSSLLEIPLPEILSVSYLVPASNPIDPACIWGQPVVLYGMPGIGKTARVRQSAKAVGLQCGVIELGGAQPEDAKGIPFLTKDDKIVIACLLQQVNYLNEVGAGVLFLDEVNWARPATQGAFMSLVQERRIGDTEVSNFVRVVLAGNPPEVAGGGYMLTPPMANRCAHFDVPIPSEAEEAAYLMGQPMTLDNIEEGQRKIVDKWAEEHARQVGLMLGFRRRFPDHAFEFPENGDPQASKAWPSPRSRENAIRCVTTCRILGKDPLIESAFFAACCGPRTAINWAIWQKEADLPDPALVLKNGFKPDHRLDIAISVLSSAVSYTLGQATKADREKLAPNAWNLLNQFVDARLVDLVVPPARALIRAGFGSKSTAAVVDAARPVLLYMAKNGYDKYVSEGP